MARPPTRTLPASGAIRPTSMDNSVVLPAPFGPRRPKNVPLGTASVTPSRARRRVPGYALTTPSKARKAAAAVSEAGFITSEKMSGGWIVYSAGLRTQAALLRFAGG